MGYGLINTAGPVLEPITLAEAKSHLVVGHADDDALITRLIGAAREQTEIETGRRWMPQTLTMSFERFPRRRQRGGLWDGPIDDVPNWHPVVPLPVAPVSAVNVLRYRDSEGLTKTLTQGAEYLAWLAHLPPILYPAPGMTWPDTQAGRMDAVEVEFVAGYVSAIAVPNAAKVAMLLAIGLWYENRGDAEDPTELGLPIAAIRLLRSLSTGSYS